jgi:hypothetical protein
VYERLGALVRSTIRAVPASLAVAVAGVTVEYAVRLLVKHAMSRVAQQSAAALAEALPPIPTRVVVTEIIVRERVRRSR